MYENRKKPMWTFFFFYCLVYWTGATLVKINWMCFCSAYNSVSICSCFRISLWSNNWRNCHGRLCSLFTNTLKIKSLALYLFCTSWSRLISGFSYARALGEYAALPGGPGPFPEGHGNHGLSQKGYTHQTRKRYRTETLFIFFGNERTQGSVFSNSSTKTVHLIEQFHQVP